MTTLAMCAVQNTGRKQKMNREPGLAVMATVANGATTIVLATNGHIQINTGLAW